VDSQTYKLPNVDIMGKPASEVHNTACTVGHASSEYLQTFEIESRFPLQIKETKIKQKIILFLSAVDYHVIY
jgi:hypothetical protein